jgi:pimeloyl-ACP methyl ester carboxylesterase
MADHPRDVDAAPVAWREAGEGPTVLFLHGLGMTRTGFDPQLEGLADAYRAVAWDQPGYGASPAASDPLTFAGLADAVAALLDTLGTPRAHLVGLSLGGMVALHTAVRHPGRVRSLALLDTSAAFGLDGTDADIWRRARLTPLDGGATPASMAVPVLRSIMAPGATDEAVELAAASMARISADGLRAAVQCLPTQDVRADLHAIDVPTLVVVGELDEETPPAYARALAAAIPRARLAMVAGAGHIVNLEAPAVVTRLLRTHVDAVEEGQP